MNVGNKCGSFSVIIQDIWTTFDTELKKQPSWRNVPNSLMMKIQDGSSHIKLFKMSVSQIWTDA